MKEYLQKQFEKLGNKYDAYSLRERILILSLVLVATFLLWQNFLYGVVFTSDKEIIEATQKLRTQINTIQGEISTISSSIVADKQAAERLKTLKEENLKLKDEVLEQTKNMVSPKEMATIIKKLLDQSHGLTILRLEADPITEFFSAKEKTADLKVYNHGITLVFEGEYFDVLNFLKQLEKADLKLIWDLLDYEVKKYPVAKVTIQVHTLSLDAGWIGV